MLRISTAFIWGGLAVFLAVLYVVLHVFVVRSFVELERTNTTENVDRLLSAVTERTASINAKASDWAAWDDAHQFMQDRNSRFIRSNFVLSAFTGNDLNLIAYVDDSGAIAYGRWHHPGSDRIVPIPDDVRSAIGREGKLTSHRNVRGSVSGIVMLKRGPMLVASRPVVTSNEKGPIRGSFIFGQLLDADEVQGLSKIIHLPIAIERLDDRGLPADFAQARAKISRSGQAVVEPTSKRVVSGYTVLDDIYGEPAVMMRLDMPRTLYNRGLTLTDYTLAALAVLSILFGSIGSILLVRAVRQEHEFDSKTREFYRSTIEAATNGKLTVCEQKYMPDVDEALGKWEIAHPEDVSPARHEIAEIAQAEGMQDPSLTDFTLCVGESITNAVKHAGGGTASLYRRGDRLLLVVSDHGPGIEALAIPELALKPRYSTAASLGVGYKLIISLADKVYLATGPKGTTVAMEKQINGARSEATDYWIPDTWSA